MFRDSFKYYKSRNSPPDLKDVIDLNGPSNNHVTLRTNFRKKFLNEQCQYELGLKPVEDWQIYEFFDIPGLIFIKNPFTSDGQRYWIIKCLKDYSRKPHKLNLDAHDVLGDGDAWWDLCVASNKAKELLPKLRWATLGYHHNWDTKLYSEASKTEMPNELSLLTSVLANTLHFMDFKAEAAIINYYRMNSTLAGHTDHSEVNSNAPLFSISFGQTAIFLIGGHKQDDPANAILLRSGDIIVMSGESRLRYHGVPKILSATTTPWVQEERSENKKQYQWHPDDWNKAETYISEARINMNVRQVLKPGQTSLL
ncbi:alpha-ketoglutarate-dependent dioxygenase AlkB [Nomia melanderi]|uniref:alpha-ketoglutarate-dependent dioxygenase AlkB n=1 Tax=Nomia melanderi TaxID=2448451 RepID=UPI003FCDA18F